MPGSLMILMSDLILSSRGSLEAERSIGWRVWHIVHTFEDYCTDV
jgi:hypothetical protein